MLLNFSFSQHMKAFHASAHFNGPADPDYTWAACERVFDRAGTVYEGSFMGSCWLSSTIPVIQVDRLKEPDTVITVEQHAASPPALMFGLIYAYAFFYFALTFLEAFHKVFIEGKGIHWARKIIDLSSPLFAIQVKIFGGLWQLMEPLRYSLFAIYLGPAMVVLIFYLVSRFIQFRIFKKSSQRLFEAIHKYQEKKPHETPELPERKKTFLSSIEKVTAPFSLENKKNEEIERLISVADSTLSKRKVTVEKTGSLYRLYREKTYGFVSFFPRGEVTDIELHGSLKHSPWIFSFFASVFIYLILLFNNVYILFAPLMPEGFTSWSPPEGMLTLKTMSPWIPALILGPLSGIAFAFFRARILKKKLHEQAKHYVTILKTYMRE